MTFDMTIILYLAYPYLTYMCCIVHPCVYITFVYITFSGAHLSVNDSRFNGYQRLDISWILIISICVPIDSLLLVFTRSIAHNDYYRSIHNNEHCSVFLSITNALTACYDTCHQCWIDQEANQHKKEIQEIKQKIDLLIINQQTSQQQQRHLESQTLINNNDSDEQKIISSHPLTNSTVISDLSEIEMETVSNSDANNPAAAIPSIRLNYCYYCGAQQHIHHPRYCYACGKRVSQNHNQDKQLDKVTNILVTRDDFNTNIRTNTKNKTKK